MKMCKLKYYMKTIIKDKFLKNQLPFFLSLQIGIRWVIGQLPIIANYDQMIMVSLA